MNPSTPALRPEAGTASRSEFSTLLARSSPLPDPEPAGQVASFEGRQRLLVATGDHTGQASEAFVKVYHSLVQSGLLAHLSGNEVKLLLALALEARVLGGDARAERHFARLKSSNVVTDADRGRLFCCLDRESLACRAGLSVRTVSTAAKALAARQLIEKRSVRGRNGWHAYADGILNNWARAGPPRPRRQGQPRAPPHPTAVPARRQPAAAPASGHLLLRQPRTEEQELWEQILGDLQLQMARATFDQWLRGSELLDLRRPQAGVARLVVQVTSPYALDWLEHRLIPLIQRTVERRLGQEASLTFRARDGPQRSVAGP
jgi:hypothetical protein